MSCQGAHIWYMHEEIHPCFLNYTIRKAYTLNMKTILIEYAQIGTCIVESNWNERYAYY